MHFTAARRLGMATKEEKMRRSGIWDCEVANGYVFIVTGTDSAFCAGSYTCQIFWKGDPSIENFIIRFATADMMKQGAQQIESQRRKYRDRDGRNSDGSQRRIGYGSGTVGGTSVTEFEYMRGMPAMENPYAGMMEEEDEDDVDKL